MIGTFQTNGIWNESIFVSDVISTDPIDGFLNAKSKTIDLSGLGEAATLVPSAITVQIMCPTALDSATGIIYAGVMNTQADIGGRSESWATYFEKFVQFQAPRLLSAGKLVLRGVQGSSMPLNMTEVSKFTPLYKLADTAFTWSTFDTKPRGWAPIMVYNPSGTTLELLITVEYRVRFDLDHPASASHTHHKVATDTSWDNMSKKASAIGHGISDIADIVANTGEAVGKALRAAKSFPLLAAAA